MEEPSLRWAITAKALLSYPLSSVLNNNNYFCSIKPRLVRGLGNNWGIAAHPLFVPSSPKQWGSPAEGGQMVMAHLWAVGPFSSPPSSLLDRAPTGINARQRHSGKTGVRLGWGKRKDFPKACEQQIGTSC